MLNYCNNNKKKTSGEPNKRDTSNHFNITIFAMFLLIEMVAKYALLLQNKTVLSFIAKTYSP